MTECASSIEVRCPAMNRPDDDARGAPGRKSGPWRLSQRGINWLAHHEGGNLPLYNDPNGNCTVGVGHLIRLAPCTEEDRKQYGSLSSADRLKIFRSDLARFQSAVNRMVEVPLHQYEFDALLSFVWNIGYGTKGFGGSTARRLLNNGRYQLIPTQMMRWGPSNVRGRRCDEARLFATGRFTVSLRCPP